MMPRWNEYGIWPASGEVDIVESRGNNRPYPGGANHMGSTLHFGPSWNEDAWSTATASVDLPNGTFHDAFHIFGFYWDNTTIYTYIDNDSNRVLEINVTKQSFWDRGQFPKTFTNPWMDQPNIAPFNQEYYLIFNLAVGGVNGYFPDGVGSKPWSDTSSHAANDFYAAKTDWYATWNGEDSALQVDWVKVYQSPAQHDQQVAEQQLAAE